jgi:hypothetical protein
MLTPFKRRDDRQDSSQGRTGSDKLLEHLGILNPILKTLLGAQFEPLPFA